MTQLKPDFDSLRRQAQARMKNGPPPDLTDLANEDTSSLAENLHLHQIELELQHDQLHRSYVRLERAQEHYAQLADRYQLLYDFAPVGYFTLDPDSYIQTVNLTGADQLETTRKLLHQRRFTDYIVHDSQDTFFHHRYHLLRRNAPRQVCELEMVTAGGKHFYARLESVVVKDPLTQVMHLQTALIDITVLKEAETALQQRGDKLEELVAARTAELAEANAHLQAEIEERIQAQASLQASNERLQAALAELSAAQEQVLQQERLMAVGQLAAGIAHDFNNILTPIMGYADLLLRQAQKTDGRSERQMAIILEQSQQARRLVRQLLDFSRQSVHHPQAIEFKSFLADSLKLLTHMLPETIQIRLDGVPGEYWLTGDPAQLQQVITNLALNAQDAMPAGGSLTFKLSSSATKPGKEPPPPEAEQGAWLLLTVTDDGCGMPADVVPHIFEPFFTTKDVGRGSGLGLAQVYGIVQQHGGDINVQSSPDQGTCFTIYLPQLVDKALLPPEA